MSNSLTIAGIVVPIIAAVAGAAAQHFIPRFAQQRSATRAGLDKLVNTTWDAKWYMHGRDEPYVVDRVRLRELKRGKLRGIGDGPGGEYPVELAAEDHGVLRGTYEASGQSKYDMIGSIVLRRDVGNSRMEGQWCGFSSENTIVAGRVEWSIAT